MNLVLGIGNEYRRDDAVGLFVARKLAEKGIPGCVVKESPGEGTYLMDAWENCDLVIIVDAVKSESEHGKIHRIDTATEDIPTGWFQCSSHLFSLPEAIKLSKTLSQMPKSLIIYGIEGNLFETGTDISKPVLNSAEKIIPLIIDEVSTYSAIA